MPLSHDRIEQFHNDGYLLLERIFAAREVEYLRAALPEILGRRGERTVLEDSGQAVRSVYGVHWHDPPLTRLGRLPRLVDAARALLAGDVYIYQSKLNVKSPRHGELWDWHQDYTFWREQDRMPAPHVLTAAVFLDDVHADNGPITVIPGSHRDGLLASFAPAPDPDPDAPAWQAHVSARLEYTIDRAALARLVETCGVRTVEGPAGSVLLFDGRLVHASPANRSPHPRQVALYTYNRVDNAPPPEALRRPAFLASRERTAVVPVDDEALLRPAAAAASDEEAAR